MKLSQRGLDLLRSRCPAAALTNLIYCGDRYAHVAADVAHGYPARTQGANASHVFRREFSSRVGLSPQVNETVTPLEGSVFGERNPLKVRCAVIGFDAVDVVNREMLGVSRYKSASHKAMGEVASAFPLGHKANRNVASPQHFSIEKPRRFRRSDGSVSPSIGTRVNKLRSPHAPEVRNLDGPIVPVNPIDLLPAFHGAIYSREVAQ
jgi:hypothetical protein